MVQKHEPLLKQNRENREALETANQEVAAAQIAVDQAQTNYEAAAAPTSNDGGFTIAATAKIYLK